MLYNLVRCFASHCSVIVAVAESDFVRNFNIHGTLADYFDNLVGLVFS